MVVLSDRELSLDPPGAQALRQCSAKPEEPDALTDAAWERHINQIITFQGLLVEFRGPVVRSAFLGGYFGVSDCSDDMLKSIDLIRDLMLPHPGVFNSRKHPTVLAGVSFFSKLLRDEPSEPSDLRGQLLPVRKSYKEWSDYLDLLKYNQY